MSTILNTNGDSLIVPALSGAVKGNFVVVTAEWNPSVTHTLRDGAIKVLIESGIPQERIISLEVPGTVELISAAAMAANSDKTAVVIVIGCVIRGDTPHFDYVCQIASQGVASINAAGKVPVIFGVLTVNNLEQAHQRAGGILGNKGAEAGVAAVRMANLHSFWNSHGL